MFAKEENVHTGCGRCKLVVEGPTERLEHLLCVRLELGTSAVSVGEPDPGPSSCSRADSCAHGRMVSGGLRAFRQRVGALCSCLLGRLHERSLVLASPTVTSGAVFLGVQWKFLCIGLSCLFCYTLTVPLQIVRETLRVF